MQVRLDVLLGELEALREVRTRYGTELELGAELRERLQGLASDRRRREESLSREAEPATEVAEALADAGFVRELKPFQLENLRRMLALPHGADFSVPGAGKTSVALANFALQRKRENIERLLVIAPLAAFASWKEDAEECFAEPPRVAVHLGAEVPVPATPDIMLTNYHRLAGDYDRVRAWVSSCPTQVVLDEAHRVKRGREGVHGRAALDLAFAAARRDVLTGTPAPQGAGDVIALTSYLYPGQAHQILPAEAFNESLGREPDVLLKTHEAVARYFVRTRKSDLGLPPTEISVHRSPMGPIQAAIYEALRGEYRGAFQLAERDRYQMRRLGQILMYLLEAATNPLLLLAGADEDDLVAFRHPPLALRGNEDMVQLLARYADYETPWKYVEVERIVEQASSDGEKVLIWTSFVRNIRQLEAQLERFHPAVVHGGIPPVDGAPPGARTTREAELDRFRLDPECGVLLANPAACGEGVSLHHWCHHAVYLDRTFNAGHYLQSQDRIHRLGLAGDVVTRFTILCSEGTIDEFVESRLRSKVEALAALMDDPGLVAIALPADEEIGDVADQVGSAFDPDDASIVRAHLDGPA